MKNSLKSISPTEQKRILLHMLKYIDNICRKNDIKYSLIGGSLIGAIRHKGFIPWDDDIDIILDRDNYYKLMEVLKNDNNKNYDVFIPGETNNYPIAFAKLIKKNTIVKESNLIDTIDNYGLFLDIFKYDFAPENEKERKKYYKRYHYYQCSLTRVKLNSNLSFVKKIIRVAKNIYLTIFGYKHHLKKIIQLQNKYSKIPSNYVMSNNPVYGYKKEIQNADLLDDYIDVDFEGLKVMIFKKYDALLKNIYGNYMKLPPVEKRVSHNLEVYWKDKNGDAYENINNRI